MRIIKNVDLKGHKFLYIALIYESQLHKFIFRVLFLFCLNRTPVSEGVPGVRIIGLLHLWQVVKADYQE